MAEQRVVGSVRIEWRGEELAAVIARDVPERLERAAGHVVETAKALVSVPFPPASEPGEPPRRRSGELEESIGATPFDNGFGQRIGSPLLQAGILELGTRRVEARPFMRPALRIARKAIVGEFRGV